MGYCPSDYCPGCNSLRCICNELERMEEEERDLDLESLEEACQREINMPEEEEIERVEPIIQKLAKAA